MEESRTGCRPGLSVLVMVIAIVLGTSGGAIVGGVAGYSVARYFTPSALVAPAAEVAPSNTYLTLTEDSAIISAVAAVKPAVVTVINTLPPQRGYFGQILEPQASGSGVFISASRTVRAWKSSTPTAPRSRPLWSAPTSSRTWPY
jgi:hypothetical protein